MYKFVMHSASLIDQYGFDAALVAAAQGGLRSRVLKGDLTGASSVMRGLKYVLLDFKHVPTLSEIVIPVVVSCILLMEMKEARNVMVQVRLTIMARAIII